MTAAEHDAELAVLRTMAAEWRRREDEAAADLAWLADDVTAGDSSSSRGDCSQAVAA